MITQWEGGLDRGDRGTRHGTSQKKTNKETPNTKASLTYVLFLFVIKGLAKMERSTHC